MNINNKNNIKIQIYNEEYKGWFDIDIGNIRKKNIIRIFRNGQIDKDQQGNITRLTLCDAWIDEDNNWHIKSDGFKMPQLTGEEGL